VIGGAEIFALFEPMATLQEITEVAEQTGGEVRMPAPGPGWVETAREEHPAADGWPPYAFVTYRRVA
jgi:dihydrofolate reductase